MQRLEPALKYMLIATAVAIALCTLLASVGIWGYRGAYQLARFSLPGGHKIRLSMAYNLDVANDVRCKLSGPSVHHSAQFIGGIGASQSRPSFTLHRVSNSQVFWITSETLPLTVLYAVNLDTGEYWPGADGGTAETLKGQRLLQVINTFEAGHSLNNHSRWIGVERPS